VPPPTLRTAVDVNSDDIHTHHIHATGKTLMHEEAAGISASEMRAEQGKLQTICGGVMEATYDV
jgi:hypothetical protein